MAAAMAGGKSKKKEMDDGGGGDDFNDDMQEGDEMIDVIEMAPEDANDDQAKGKVREKMQNKVLFDEDTYARLIAEIPKMKLITPSALVERLKINGSLARAAIKEMAEKGQIKQVAYHHTQWIYTRDSAAE
eukprot:CAMPEP_0206842068 /NCGR_PEP_ID=MMETSP0975-20121206/22771_1 /ASSEMBLY_ACC=CAM_ASM_000399 /TAXON_ID=483370 /ORGANISM="non described non described, Strain CCMP2097" /LENGTH=130 /DNA_ID=CAMNT_0054384587 /DNA_START=1 /DNA_END=393 /DNA_ORIENTATION=-